MNNNQNNEKQSTLTLHVGGMHCAACVVMIDSELSERPDVGSAMTNLASRTVVVTGDFGVQSPEEIAALLSHTLAPHGYTLSMTPINEKKKWNELVSAAPIALLFILFFVVLQKMGLINLVGGGNVTYGTAFVIGIIASLSSCMAVVGGLLLALSATFAERGEKFTPHLLFHVGRLLSFFVLGGVIGSLGAVFTLSSVTTAILSVAIGLVMLLLGVNLLNLFPEVERLIPAMPKIIAGKTKTLLALNGTLMPFLVGGATFFLPCGFTQSMQLYTLSTGSFAHGSLTMLFFALGTLPVLFAISVSAYRITAHRLSGVFFKVAGLIVIAFALLNISNSLVAFGLIAPIIQL